jgi:ubiquinone/menaquinone biosynthesis C-methylase UbiE
MNTPDYSQLYKDKKAKDLSKISTFRKIKSFAKKGDILDIACGTGYLLDFLDGGTGIDINPNLVKEAKKNYPHCEFIVSNCYNIPLENEKFDTVSMCMIIEHLDEPKKALLEAKRLMKSDGNLIIVTPRKDDFFYKNFVPKDPTHIKEYSTKEFEELISKFFKIKNIEFGSVSTKIPSWTTFFIKPDIIINCVKK